MKYNHKKTEDGNFNIFREDLHVATYDPASEETTFTSKDNEKYAGPVGKQVQVLLEIPDEGTDGGSEGDPVAAGEVVVADETGLDETIKFQKNYIKQLQAENAVLKDRLAESQGSDEDERTFRNPTRFEDKFDDSKAPAKDPRLGDLTPAYIEWARENMPRELFVKRYTRRIKDL